MASVDYSKTYEFRVRPMGPCGTDDFSSPTKVNLQQLDDPNYKAPELTEKPKEKELANIDHDDMAKKGCSRPRPAKTQTPYIVNKDGKQVLTWAETPYWHHYMVLWDEGNPRDTRLT